MAFIETLSRKKKLVLFFLGGGKSSFERSLILETVE